MVQQRRRFQFGRLLIRFRYERHLEDYSMPAGGRQWMPTLISDQRYTRLPLNAAGWWHHTRLAGWLVAAEKSTQNRLHFCRKRYPAVFACNVKSVRKKKRKKVPSPETSPPGKNPPRKTQPEKIPRPRCIWVSLYRIVSDLFTLRFFLSISAFVAEIVTYLFFFMMFSKCQQSDACFVHTVT